MKPSLKGTPAAVTLTDASLKDFALPSLTWPESWVAATAAWRKGSVLSRLSPKKSYASLKKQDAELFQALQSFAEANQHIDSALEKLIETPQHSGDLISPQERHVEDEQQITAGYQHGRKALDRVEQAIAAFLKEAGSGVHKDVQAALNTLKKAITAVHGKIEELKLTEGSQGLMPLELSVHLNARLHDMRAPQKHVSWADPLTEIREIPRRQPQSRSGTPRRKHSLRSPASVSTLNLTQTPSR